MNFVFFKYQGTGNDFIILDDRDARFPVDEQLIVQLCDRKFGIGSDGLILIQRSDICDFHMAFYNPDASQSFCGNGSRCAVAFAYRIGITNITTHFSAIDGMHNATIEAIDQVEVSMKDVTEISKLNDDFVLETGSPHFVRFVSSLIDENIKQIGREIRYSSSFIENGINVNIVEIANDNTLECATYERGVEDETLSCGTGVTAMALAANYYKNLPSPITVLTKGGELEVRFEKKEETYKNIYLKGPATFVFKGEIEI
jgi:diaminopimelate epimerase